MKKLVVLGSTGSIGENALKVVEALPESFEIVGLAARRNVDRLLEQAARFGVRKIAVADADAAQQCALRAPGGTEVLHGPDGLCELAAHEEADMVVCALVGIAGLQPVLAAVRRGIDVALATKEVLVAAGDLVMAECRHAKARILPIDSEHSAVLQCLAASQQAPGTRPKEVRRIVLTASGGPFGDRADINFDEVTVEQALSHPNWNMGRKVTIDSATLMNKGLEVMEACWLFDIPLDSIDVVIHPQSIVHSIVEFVDGNMLAQMCPPDMRYAIQYALTFPDRLDGSLPPLDLANTGALRFSRPDMSRFPCLALARRAANEGGTMPAVLNAANEVAVDRFLAGMIPFSGIWAAVERTMEQHRKVMNPDLDSIINADAEARKIAGEN
ncbi:MAG: 1-deoxy-D-xylulose-5-phosphate reductoisomerase [Lentisphaerales bacterium]|nr:MAG: 1-deoxy-D-xylulose-5-phosphate reductoisomerase [Lentisphaerales bacterium]